MKKHIKKSLSLLLVVIMLLAALPLTSFSSVENCISTTSNATDTIGCYKEGNLTYSLENGEAKISGCDKSISGELVIPETLGGYPVTSISGYAFLDCTGLTSITIPDSVTSIGNGAFSDCTGLTCVTIGNSVTSIDGEAFYGCTGLTSITVSSGNKVYHSENNCIVKTEEKELVLGCKKSVIPSDGSVTSIGWEAFYGCTGLTSITIPDSVTSIGWAAFCNCTGLTSITIPDSVTNIDVGAFYNCTGLTSITVSSGNKVYHSENNCIVITEEKELMLGCKKSVIPSDGSVTSIGGSAFNGCTGLTSITIPDSVTYIGGYAFSDCTGLTSVTIPDSVTSIGAYAFSDCTGLTSITIPKSVTEIGEEAFGYYSIDNQNMTVQDFTIYGYAGTAAEKYAKENGFNFALICSCNCHKTGIANFFFRFVLFFQKLFNKNKTCKCGVLHY